MFMKKCYSFDVTKATPEGLTHIAAGHVCVAPWQTQQTAQSAVKSWVGDGVSVKLTPMSSSELRWSGQQSTEDE